MNLKNLPGDGRELKDDRVAGLILRDGKNKKTWYIVKKINGKTERLKLGEFPALGLSAAREAAMQKIAEITTTGRPKAFRYTLREVFASFKKKKEGIKRSLNQDELYMRTVLAPVADMAIQDISKQDILDIKNNYRHAPVAFNRALVTLSGIYNHAIREMDIDVRNIVQAIPKNPEKPRDVVIPIEKTAALFQELDSGKYPEYFCDIVRLMIFLGKRPGNIYALEWSEIDFENAVLKISKEKVKTGRDIISTIPQEALKVLKRRREENAKNNSKWVFPSASGSGHIVYIREYIKRLGKALGMKSLHPHDLRRTHGTWMLNAGASIEQVSRSLDHSSIAITERVYAKIQLEKLREGQEILAQSIRKATGKND